MYYTEESSIYGILSKLSNTFERVIDNLPKLSDYCIHLSLFLEKKTKKSIYKPKNSQWPKEKELIKIGRASGKQAKTAPY